MTKRWPFNVLMYLIDIAAFNAFTLHRMKCPEVYKKQINRERLNSLEMLCKELLDPEIKFRSEKFSKTNGKGCNFSLQESFRIAGHELSKAMSPARNKSPFTSPLNSPASSPKNSRKTCEICREENEKQIKPKHTAFLTKSFDRCIACNVPVCSGHNYIYCKSCYKND